MAFVNGTANSLADLLAAIQNACIGNGWTLSGSVLHKGPCYAELVISGSYITVRGGTGVDGSNVLTGATDQTSGRLGNVSGFVGFTFPVTYDVHVHASPDEVYVVVNHDLDAYQTIAFGQSSQPGLLGTGNWYCGVAVSQVGKISFGTQGENGLAGQPFGYSLFCRSDTNSDFFGVDHRLDSNTWLVEGAWRDWASFFFRQPNQWNQESILIPIRVYAARPSGFVSPVLECAHARFVSIANLQDQQIITLGSDKWKIYPWWHRSSTTGFQTYGSGYAGHAIRYDGP